ncbi:MAG: hypothetical protein M3P38_10485 [Chloroflexota bacterium]|nr:hypothetical protein [Chloroflexota bacterium]
MSETPIAFPNDETTAEVIASRLRAAGITARVDRGLFGSGQVSASGQMTVFVDEGDAECAGKLVGKPARKSAPGLAILRLALGARAVGAVAIAAAVAAR